jgi:hypothetical protein
MAKPRQLGFDEISEEWKGMPEYVQEKETPFRTLRINFRNQEDLDKFCELLGLEIMDKTRSAWYPKLERGQYSNLRWVDANEGEIDTVTNEVRDVLG